MVLVVIANAVRNAVVGPETSLSGGVLAAVVLLVLNSLVPGFAFAGPAFGGRSKDRQRHWCCAAR